MDIWMRLYVDAATVVVPAAATWLIGEGISFMRSKKLLPRLQAAERLIEAHITPQLAQDLKAAETVLVNDAAPAIAKFAHLPVPVVVALIKEILAYQAPPATPAP